MTGPSPPAGRGPAGDDGDPRRAMHDMGGVPRFLCEPIDTAEHTLTDFDREVDAIRQLLSLRGLMSVDELRRGIEAIPEPDYLRLSYYEKWIRSIAATLLARGVISAQELGRALAAQGGANGKATRAAACGPSAQPAACGPSAQAAANATSVKAPRC